MFLSHLHINAMRNLRDVKIQPHAQMNYLVGANGSGKTSLLEAIYLLATGRSFRSSQVAWAIQHDQNELTVFAELSDHHTLMTHQLGYSKARQEKARLKINGDAVRSVVEMAKCCPVLLLYSESYALFRDSPRTRCKYLDWGMFHVEHCFYPLWKKLKKILAQRNFLLKQQAPLADITAWDAQLIEVSESIHALRLSFISIWQSIVNPILIRLFDRDDFLLTYTPGWDLDLGFKEVLKKNLTKDRFRGYTGSGPHRADIQIYRNGVAAQHTLSLGQQKLLVSGIVLSQALLLQKIENKTSLLLIDDLPAELDEAARIKIASVIQEIQTQVFLTAIDQHTLKPFLNISDNKAMFHVEHGCVNI